MVKLAVSGVAHDTPRKRQESVSGASRRLEKQHNDELHVLYSTSDESEEMRKAEESGSCPI
jgi:hypothetical protein